MNVKERHDVEAAIGGRKVQRAADVARRRAQIGVAQGDDLGPAGGARGVQHEGDVGGLRTTAFARRAGRRAGERKRPGRGARLQFQHRDTVRSRDLDRRGLRAGLDDQRLRREVGQIKVELGRPVGRIERRGGRTRGEGEEGARHIRAVGQHDRDAVSAPESERVQRGDRRVHVAAQGGVFERRAFGRADGDRAVRALGDQSVNGVRIRHMGSDVPRFRCAAGNPTGAGPPAASNL